MFAMFLLYSPEKVLLALCQSQKQLKFKAEELEEVVC